MYGHLASKQLNVLKLVYTFTANHCLLAPTLPTLTLSMRQGIVAIRWYDDSISIIFCMFHACSNLLLAFAGAISHGAKAGYDAPRYKISVCFRSLEDVQSTYVDIPSLVSSIYLRLHQLFIERLRKSCRIQSYRSKPK